MKVKTLWNNVIFEGNKLYLNELIIYKRGKVIWGIIGLGDGFLVYDRIILQEGLDEKT